MARWSPQYQYYISAGMWPPFPPRVGGRCPSCHKRMRGIMLSHGEEVRGLRRSLNPSFGLLDADTIMRCTKCGAEWPVLLQADPADPE